MAADDLQLADLAELGDLLVADPSPLRSFNVDPSKVQLPGIWCRIDSLGVETLRGLTISTTLHLIVGDADWNRSAGNLAPLFNHVKGVLRGLDGADITGPATVTGVILPGSQTPMPAFALPVNLTTTQESE